MPVEERLRRGLDANARVFVPEGEERLVQVHRRRARAGALAATVVAAAVVTVAGIAGSWFAGSTEVPEPAPASSQEASPTPVHTGPRIPDSHWRKVVTKAQLVRAGADQAFLAENLGSADRLPTTLSFIGDVYSQSGRYPGAWAVGDAGTVDYESGGRLVLTSTSSGCRGCVASFTWRVQGDRLSLTGFHGAPNDPLPQVMLEGVWERIDD